MTVSTPTQAAIKRGIAALEGAGKPVTGLRIMRDGSVMILATDTQTDLASEPETGEDAWDKAIGAA